MEDDFEESAFRKDERLEKLESVTNRLSRKINDLSNEFSKLELSRLHDQITNLHKKIGELEEFNLETRRHLAWLDIESLRIFIDDLGVEYLGKNSPDYFKLYDYVRRKSAAAMQEVESSLEPIQISKNFRRDCRIYCERHNLETFLEE